MERVMRIDPFDEGVDKANGLLGVVVSVLEPLVGALTEKEREELIPTPEGVPAAIRAMLGETGLLARVTPACDGFDADKVKADLEYAAKIAPLAYRAEYLARLIGDAYRSRLSRAYGQGLAVYAVAKAAVVRDATLLPLVLPLQEMYASRKKPAKKGKEAEAAPAAPAAPADSTEPEQS